MRVVNFHRALWPLALLVLLAPLLAATELYRYKDEQGNWVYSDRPPPGRQDVISQEMRVERPRPTIRMTDRRRAGEVDLVAINTFEVPIEVILQITEADNLNHKVGDVIRHVVAATADEVVATVTSAQPGGWSFAYQTRFVIGDPQARHRPPVPYRAPFAAASQYPISQAFPGKLSHFDAANRYAVDIQMPVGTPIYAARGGTVIDQATHFFANGTDLEKDGPRANLVRIVHDDGSIAVYAHLNWDSIRVRIGDEVDEGEYIADSGNTGFSTGPHLHFDVQLNREMELVSVPFRFRNERGDGEVPRAGQMLQNLP
ncbi:MAG: M23 family metallopeptidase [Proteobacteria bacterium]|nr:M23 family metallopeptidase [Pseudomonadota bacterium]